MTKFSMTVVAVLVIAGSSALAQSDSMTIESAAPANQTFMKSSETSNIAATNRAQALMTDSIFYSLPRENMTFMKLGAYNQKQKLNSANFERIQSNNQAFFFEHSRGLTEDMALDFNLDYFMQDESALQRATGVNEALIGLRSNFQGMGMNWVYGGSMMYIPQGEYGDKSSKLAVAAKIGFEEAVDIARWGFQMEASTKDSALFQNQLNLVGFFEFPFVKSFNVGVTAGADITKISSSEQNNFAKVYGQYSIDTVSAAEISMRQANQKNNDDSLSEAEVGLALTRVF